MSTPPPAPLSSPIVIFTTNTIHNSLSFSLVPRETPTTTLPIFSRKLLIFDAIRKPFSPPIISLCLLTPGCPSSVFHGPTPKFFTFPLLIPNPFLAPTFSPDYLLFPHVIPSDIVVFLPNRMVRSRIRRSVYALVYTLGGEKFHHIRNPVLHSLVRRRIIIASRASYPNPQNKSPSRKFTP